MRTNTIFAFALAVLFAACDTPTITTASIAQHVVSMPPIEDVTIVYQVGDVGAPTSEQLADILVSPPAGTEEPTVASMLVAAQAVIDSIPSDTIDDAIDELVRIGGSRVGCVFDRAWTCYIRIGARTYYCSVGSVNQCGSFLGGF